MEGSSFKFAKHIRRSFQFNCVVKLMRVKSEIKVGLFATRMKGPLCDDRSRRTLVIPEGGELVLPFDGDIPYPVQEIQWKDKKVKYVKPPEPIDAKPVKQRPPKATKLVDIDSPLTLLSAFLVDDVPVLPVILLPDRDAVEKYNKQKSARSRRNNHKGKD
jgi:hypothetical protein